MKFFVTGGAGFIGSHLVDRLLALNHEVTAYDNYSTGLKTFQAEAIKKKRYTLIQGDLLDKTQLVAAMHGCDFVFHLAANADVRFGIEHPNKDLQQNTMETFHVLEAMRENKIYAIAFSSTGSVYGETNTFPTPENAPFPIQTSLYGASKIACESLISAYCEGFGFTGYIFRFVSILGERYTHGHVFDFYKQLLKHPDDLYVLGNGKQRKSYLYVQDCIDAILCAVFNTKEKCSIFNLGTDEYCELNASIRWICEALDLHPKIEYEGSPRGWVGDNPFIFLDCQKIRALGWKPKLTIAQSVKKTVRYLQENQWLFDAVLCRI